MIKVALTTILLSSVLIASASYARDVIQIAGSSTVLPFASIVAEEFGASFPEFNTPVVASGGTGGGFKQFCQGIGENTIDVSNASRKIKDAEREICISNGVTDIREIQFGYDGIVFASLNGEFKLTPEFIYKAIAENVYIDGNFVPNPYTNWNQIDPSLPDQKIGLVIPASNHGTREVFQEKSITVGCKLAGVPEDAIEDACTKLRQDVVTEVAGDYTETLARITTDPDMVGVFGLSFYEENRDRLNVATVNGVVPTIDTIASGDYPISRPLFFYVKGQNIGVIPGLSEYTQFFLSEAMAGSGGTLEDAGLIPQPSEITDEVLTQFNSGT